MYKYYKFALNAILTVVCRKCKETISRLEALTYDGMCKECYYKEKGN